MAKDLGTLSVPIRFRKEGPKNFWKIGTNGNSTEEFVKNLLVEWGILGLDCQKIISGPTLSNLDCVEQFIPAEAVLKNKQLPDFYASRAWIVVIEDSRTGIVSLNI